MKRILLFFLTLVLLTGCSGTFDDERNDAPANSTTFNLSVISGQIEEQAGLKTRAFSDQAKSKITKLQYVILDSQGQIINHRECTLAENLSSLVVEGLRDGDYSIVFYATTNTAKNPIEAKIVDGKFVVEATQADQPFGQDQLYAHVKFTIGKGNDSQKILVELARCVGMLEVQINPSDPHTEYMIQRISITLNEGSEFYTRHSGSLENPFSGTSTLTDYDITSLRGGYSLASKAPLSGVITVEAKDDQNVIVHNSYKFSNINIEPGKISTITVDWDSPTKDRGFFRVHKSDFTAKNFSTMFLNSEPNEVFYDANQRSFTTNQPIQIKVTDDKKLQIKSYAPIDLSNVTIKCRFKRYSSEFFDLANYESIPAFSDTRMDLLVASRPVTFVAADGRNVVIDVKGQLKNEDCDFQIVTNHPYMAKIAQIKYPITISFSAYGADEGHPSWLHMYPALCRQGCVLAVNLSFMFSSDEFAAKVKGWPGNSTTTSNANPLKDGDGNVIPAQRVVDEARRISRLVMGRVGNGVAGLGGGATYGLIEYSYVAQYWDAGDILLFYRECIYHEFAHCMGYGHSGTMTYGDGWTRLTQELVHDLGSKGKFPISNSNWGTNYL